MPTQLSHLDTLEAESIHIIREVVAEFEHPAQGRGGPPPVVSEKAAPEIMSEDPQTEQRTQDRVGFPGHKIIGNLYYVGTVTLSSFLINTPAGNIVINSNYEETVPLMKTSIESLGFKLEDTKILLASHAHGDHHLQQHGGEARVLERRGQARSVAKSE